MLPVNYGSAGEPTAPDPLQARPERAGPRPLGPYRSVMYAASAAGNSVGQVGEGADVTCPAVGHCPSQELETRLSTVIVARNHCPDVLRKPVVSRAAALGWAVEKSLEKTRAGCRMRGTRWLRLTMGAGSPPVCAESWPRRRTRSRLGRPLWRNSATTSVSRSGGVRRPHRGASLPKEWTIGSCHCPFAKDIRHSPNRCRIGRAGALVGPRCYRNRGCNSRPTNRHSMWCRGRLIGSA